jgi:hypothetical protein
MPAALLLLRLRATARCAFDVMVSARRVEAKPPDAVISAAIIFAIIFDYAAFAISRHFSFRHCRFSLLISPLLIAASLACRHYAAAR